MAAVAQGFRQRICTSTRSSPTCSVSAETVDTHLRTQKLAESSRETVSSLEGLREVIEAWPRLSPELRTAVLAVTRAVTK